MSKNTGFTLIEIMVAVAIFAILASLVAPSMKNFTANNRRTAQLNHMVGSFNLARSEAVKRGATVTICARGDATNDPSNECAQQNNGRWENGWIVFVDSDGNSNVDINAPGADTVIRQYEALKGSQVRFVPFDSGGLTPDVISFDANGFLNTQLTFVRCDDRVDAATELKNARAVIVGRTGNVRVSSDNKNSDYIHEDHAGNDLVCPAP